MIASDLLKLVKCYQTEGFKTLTKWKSIQRPCKSFKQLSENSSFHPGNANLKKVNEYLMIG